jgi:pimeloyl-ACP methyl ester carboxylesterase
MKRTITWILVVVAAVAAVTVAALSLRFRRDIKAARARIAGLDHELLDTSVGPIEIATWGTGEIPVLVIHGIFGGFDQGLTMAQGWLDPTRFTAVVPSRFGYLGTPMPPEATPADQADAYVAILDALDIERAAVIGTSAGGTSALQFALYHPDRCAGLVLVASNAPNEVDHEIDAGLPPRPVAERLFRSDAVFWLLTTHFRRRLYPMVGVPQDYALTQEDEAQIGEMMNELLPMRERADGGLYDMFVGNPDVHDYPLEEVAVPTLLINAPDDPLAKYEHAVKMAERIADARLHTVSEGGHLLLGDDGDVPAEIQSFIEAQR